MGADIRKNRLYVILLGIIVLMGLEIVYLVYQNRRLQGIVDDPKQFFKTLNTDDIVPSIRAQDIMGNSVGLEYGADQPHTLLFWFSPSCSSCEDNLPFWSDLHRDHESEQVRFLGICASDNDQARIMVAEHGIEYTVMCATAPYIVEAYRGNVLPQTVLISPEGVIRSVWPGLLENERKEQILAVLEKINSQNHGRR